MKTARETDRTLHEAASLAAPDAVPADDAPTRERVATSILENGPSTAAALAARLSLTPAAVRRHLDHLVAEGALEAREPRVYGARGRGRPAKVFVLTDSGRDTFIQAYDDLAASALRFLRESVGDEAVADFARRRTAELETRYTDLLADTEGHERSTALAEALTGDGYAASVLTAPLGDQLCQHLCEAETEVFSRLLGRHVQRLATIAHGDGVCTTSIPDPGAVPRHQTSATSALLHDGTDDAEDSDSTERNR